MASDDREDVDQIKTFGEDAVQHGDRVRNEPKETTLGDWLKGTRYVKTDVFNRGFSEGSRLEKRTLTQDDCDSLTTWNDYCAGYDAGLREEIRKGSITANGARELMGLTPHEIYIFADPPRAVPLDETAKAYRETKARLDAEKGSNYDPVKIPSHYNAGQIEVANFIADQGLDYNHGNVIKYVARAGKKNPDKELEDIEKAAAYLQMVYNVAQGLPAVVRDPETKDVVWSLFRN